LAGAAQLFTNPCVDGMCHTGISLFERLLRFVVLPFILRILD
jgi:hypothetical protein